MLIKTLNLKPVLFCGNIVLFYYKNWKAWKECKTLEETMDSGSKYHSHHGKHDDFHGSGREDTGRGESQQASVSDRQWQEDSGGWKYVNAAGEFKKNRWEEISGYWYYFDNDGYMVSDWTRIGGMNYCFSETGELQLGWCYNDDEEKWHYYNEDGTAQKGWYQDKNGSWYWFSTKGEMASSGYKNVAGKRYYFYDNGQMAANQYVGLFYMDENGQRNKEFDISIDGKKTSASVSSEVKDAITEATKNIPRDWIRKFIDQAGRSSTIQEKKVFFCANDG